ncbi:MAG: SAM-dependent methyltransferase [Bacteroidales bacterium]|nr:SAM-dependent methyltransferase [Bacteroidales bacterium]
MDGKLYLIPTPLGEYEPSQVLAAPTLELLKGISLFFVEELRSARRFLSAAGLKGHIDTLDLYEINEHSTPEQISSYESLLGSRDAALISEAGLPAVADPGAQLVAMAHRKGVEVVPHPGPSSLMMALMASGLNGQCFAFAGYLPVKQDARRAAIRDLEASAKRLNQSQIMIETPYRNDSLLSDLLAVCRPETRLCIAADITCPDQMIVTRTVAQWRKNLTVIGKRPCVFIIL